MASKDWTRDLPETNSLCVTHRKSRRGIRSSDELKKSKTRGLPETTLYARLTESPDGGIGSPSLMLLLLLHSLADDQEEEAEVEEECEGEEDSSTSMLYIS